MLLYHCNFTILAMIRLYLINAKIFKISCPQYLEVLEILLLPNVHGHLKVLVF
jgi:hypothetical protein